MLINIVCLDFDQTVATYGGWHGEGYSVITGDPLPGVKDAIKKLRDAGWLVFIHSTRCGYTDGAVAILQWCIKHNIRQDGVHTNKPPADVYVDDKGLTFTGDWPATVEAIMAFKSWKNTDAKAN